jgi:hypothetical protein
MIKLKNLDPSLVTWIQGQSGIGYGIGDVFFLAPTESSTSQFRSWLLAMGVQDSKLFTSFETAYAAMATGRNDVLIIAPGGHAISAVVDVTKSYCNFIGATAPISIAQRSRLTKAVAGSAMLTVSGVGNVFKNLQIANNENSTNSLIVLHVTGGRNYFDNIHAVNNSQLANNNAGVRSLKITGTAGSADENYFINSTFGTDSVLTAADTARAVLEIVPTASVGVARNTFKNCKFLHYGLAASVFINATTVNAVDKWIDFDGCLFLNNREGGGASLTQAFNITDSGGTYLFRNGTLVFGATALQSTATDNLIGDTVAGATGARGIALTG